MPQETINLSRFMYGSGNAFRRERRRGEAKMGQGKAGQTPQEPLGADVGFCWWRGAGTRTHDGDSTTNLEDSLSLSLPFLVIISFIKLLVPSLQKR